MNSAGAVALLAIHTEESVQGQMSAHTVDVIETI